MIICLLFAEWLKSIKMLALLLRVISGEQMLQIYRQNFIMLCARKFVASSTGVSTLLLWVLLQLEVEKTLVVLEGKYVSLTI